MMNIIYIDYYVIVDSYDICEYFFFVSWLCDMFIEKGVDVDEFVVVFEEVGYIGLIYGMVFDFLNQLLYE